MLLDRGEVRDLFLVFLSRAKKRYRFQVANFCVMGNHIHLQLRPARGESLSVIMRWILGYFARAYNKKRGVSGHFWGERFHSRALESLHQFAIAFGYIDENPVKAGLVAQACDWRHGGARHSRMRDRSILDGGRSGCIFWKAFAPSPWRFPRRPERAMNSPLDNCAHGSRYLCYTVPGSFTG